MGEILVPSVRQKDIQTSFLRGEKAKFLEHMEGLLAVVHDAVPPPKVLKYLNLHKFGLPLDSTVRYYYRANTSGVTGRVEELCNVGFEVWASFATPEVPDYRISVQRKTPLIKGVRSVADYKKSVDPALVSLPRETWVKLFYDTHEEDLAKAISGAIRITSGEEREVIVEWANTADVRLIDKKIQQIQWSSIDPIWRYNKSDSNNPKVRLRVDSPKEIEIVRKIMGWPQMEYRKKMALLAQKEGRKSICFEFKIRPGTQLPFFFIDYEYAGEPGSSTFSWFFHGREGD